MANEQWDKLFITVPDMLEKNKTRDIVPERKYAGLGIDYGLIFTNNRGDMHALHDGVIKHIPRSHHCQHLYFDHEDEALFDTSEEKIYLNEEHFPLHGVIAGITREGVMLTFSYNDGEGVIFSMARYPNKYSSSAERKRLPDAVGSITCHQGEIHYITEPFGKSHLWTFPQTHLLQSKQLSDLAHDDDNLYVTDDKTIKSFNEGNWKSLVTLNERIGAMIAVQEPTRTILYCGSNVNSTIYSVPLDTLVSSPIVSAQSNERTPIVGIAAVPLT